MPAPLEQPPALAPGLRRFALYGALGFSIGGVLSGLLQAVLAQVTTTSPTLASLVASLGYGLMGLLGGAVLGLATRDLRALRRLALTGMVGFGVGGLLALLLVVVNKYDLTAAPPVFPTGMLAGSAAYAYVALMYFLAFTVRGAIGGALMGLAVGHRHSVRFLSLTGALGFGLGGAAGFGVLSLPGLHPYERGTSVVWFLSIYAVWAASTTAVGGAALGAGLGMLSWARRPS